MLIAFNEQLREARYTKTLLDHMYSRLIELLRESDPTIPKIADVLQLDTHGHLLLVLELQIDFDSLLHSGGEFSDTLDLNTSAYLIVVKANMIRQRWDPIKYKIYLKDLHLYSKVDSSEISDNFKNPQRSKLFKDVVCKIGE